MIPGTVAAQESFCKDCRSVLERYATQCLHEAAAAIYNSTIDIVCEKQSDFNCNPTVEQQACALRYGLTGSLFNGDGDFCRDCKTNVIDYARTCVGETAADGVSRVLDVACLTFGNSDSGRDSDSDKENDEDSNDDSGANVIGVALLSIVQALFLSFEQ